MSIRLPCSCGKTLRLNNSRPGARITCPSCGAGLTVPGSREYSDRKRAEEFERAGPRRYVRGEEPAGVRWGLIGLIAGITVPVLAGLVVLIVWLASGGAPEAKKAEFAGDDPRRAEERKKGGPEGRHQQEVNFLRSVAKGNRFVIIADRSGSMDAPVRSVDPVTKAVTMTRSITSLQEELIKTLKEFTPETFFYVSFFDDTHLPMPMGDNWVKGGGPLDTLIPWVRGIHPGGGTQPMSAFRKAFSLDPRPDVIFFMTDGMIPPDVAGEVARMNAAGGKKVVINTIWFDNAGGVGGPFGGAGHRYARLLELYRFPEPVRKQWEMLAGGVGFVPGGLGGAGKLLEDIAKENGGTFTVFGRIGEKEVAPPGKGGPTLDPALAVTDQLLETDLMNPHRPGSRCKVYSVFMRAGATYQIDMAAGFDTYLHLEDPTGRMVAVNDDFVGLNAMIQFTAPANGNYRILASSYGGVVRMPFVLTMIDQPLPGPGIK